MLEKKINVFVDYLQQQQQPDGSFLAFISSGFNNLQNAKKYKSTLSTAIILSCLTKLQETTKIKEIKQEATKFLLSQKSDNWTFNDRARDSENNKIHPDNLFVTFYVLCALMQYDSLIIDGEAIARILMILTAAEEKEGGPYYAFPHGKNGNNIDLAVNSHIGNLLFLQNVNLPELDQFIEKAIESQNFNSNFYTSPYPIIYCISQFYKGNQKKQIINFILSKQNEDKQWDNSLQTTLAINSLINLGYPAEKLQDNVKYLKKCPATELLKPYTFSKITNPQNNQTLYLSSPTLTTAFCLPIFETQTIEQPIEDSISLQTDKSSDIYNQIIKLTEQKLSSLNGELKKYTTNVIKNIIEHDKNHQITLLSHFFKTALGQKGQNISDDMIIQLGLANVYLWAAYTLYDDFLDEEGDPKLLSTANVCLREFTNIFNNILNSVSNNPLISEEGLGVVRSKFQIFFNQIMDELDGANAWETTNCRALRTNDQIQIPDQIVDYGDYSKLAERSLAHAMGPAAILFALGYTKNSPEVKNIMSFFKHYLIARQLDDDAHDWEKDLRQGHIDGALAPLLKKWKTKYLSSTTIDLKKDLSELQQIFWYETIDYVCQNTLANIELSKIILDEFSLMQDKSWFTNLLTPIEHSAKKALKEQRDTVQFLETYQSETTNTQALDVIFNFFPNDVLNKLKQEGLYDLILSKKIINGAEMYDYLSENQSALQDADYSWLADKLQTVMRTGSVLQIGCGRGDLLLRLGQKGFTPMYGIDRSKIMLNAAKKRLANFKNVYLFQEKVENFNCISFGNINNVIINNFWGMISEKDSIDLLNNLRQCLKKDSIIIIGPYSKDINQEKLKAQKTLQENLSFTFSYPFYKDFSKCGYNSQIIEINDLKYFLLSPQDN